MRALFNFIKQCLNSSKELCGCAYSSLTSNVVLNPKWCNLTQVLNSMLREKTQKREQKYPKNRPRMPAEIVFHLFHAYERGATTMESQQYGCVNKTCIMTCQHEWGKFPKPPFLDEELQLFMAAQREFWFSLEKNSLTGPVPGSQP